MASGLNLCLFATGDSAVHVYDEYAAFVGRVAVSASLIDIIFWLFIRVEHHGIWEEDFAGNFDSIHHFGNYELITVFKDEVGEAAGIGKGLVEFDTNVVAVGSEYFVYGDRVVSGRSFCESE